MVSEGGLALASIQMIAPSQPDEGWQLLCRMAAHDEYVPLIHTGLLSCRNDERMRIDAALHVCSQALDFDNTPLPCREHITVNIEPLLHKTLSVRVLVDQFTVETLSNMQTVVARCQQSSGVSVQERKARLGMHLAALVNLATILVDKDHVPLVSVCN